VLLVVGMYAPSSSDGVYIEGLWLAHFAVLVVLFLILLLRKNGVAGPWLCANSIVLVAVIIAASILSPFPDYRWGGLLGYMVLSLLFALNLRDVTARPYLRYILFASNVVNITLGFGIVLGVASVRDFFVTYYAASYPELLANMIGSGKPVLSMGTHSVAAFFFYLFFWLSFETYKVRHRAVDGLFALGYIVLGFLLFSVSGFVLMAAATLQVLFHMSWHRPKVLVTVLSVVLICGWVTVSRFADRVHDVTEMATMTITNVLESPTNGLPGRFSQGGTLYSTLNYLRYKPFSPVGVGYRSDLFFGDSGFVEHYLRGSVFLLVAIYGGLFAFLGKNLISKADVTHLIAVILFFELGFSVLVSVRFLYLLPVLVVYLNDLRRSSDPGHVPGSPINGPATWEERRGPSPC